MHYNATVSAIFPHFTNTLSCHCRVCPGDCSPTTKCQTYCFALSFHAYSNAAVCVHLRFNYKVKQSNNCTLLIKYRHKLIFACSIIICFHHYWLVIQFRLDEQSVGRTVWDAQSRDESSWDEQSPNFPKKLNLQSNKSPAKRVASRTPCGPISKSRR